MMKKISLLWPYLKRHKLLLFLSVTAAVISSVGTIVATYVVGLAIDTVPGLGKVNNTALFFFLCLLSFLYLTASLFRWITARCANRISFSIACRLRKDAFAVLSRAPLSYYDTTPHGDILSKFSNDLDAVSDALSITLLQLFTGVVTIIVCIGIMFTIHAILALTVILVTPLCIFFAVFISKSCQKSFQEGQTALGDLSAFISERISAQKTTQIFSQEHRVCQAFSSLSETYREKATKAIFLSACVNPGTRFVNYTCYIIIGLVGATLALTQGLSVGMISTFLIYSNQFAKPFNDISSITTQIQTAAASIERIFSLLHAPEQPPESPKSQTIDRCKKQVCFDHVSFSYQPERPIIRDFSFCAKQGQMIALVGPTGCGKTTIINLLMRFYEPDAGTISIDGIDIKNLKKASLRHLFGMVLQDAWLSSGTVAENIAYGRPNASREEIVQAAKAAYADFFIKQLPNGYDTVITKETFSQGERQLLTIARAMLANPDIMILDEATSCVDTLTELRIQKAIEKLTKDRTSFVIAHRLSTIKAADLILVMDQGHIAESGTHETLMKKQGIYAQLQSLSHL